MAAVLTDALSRSAAAHGYEGDYALTDYIEDGPGGLYLISDLAVRLKSMGYDLVRAMPGQAR